MISNTVLPLGLSAILAAGVLTADVESPPEEERPIAAETAKSALAALDAAAARRIAAEDPLSTRRSAIESLESLSAVRALTVTVDGEETTYDAHALRQALDQLRALGRVDDDTDIPVNDERELPPSAGVVAWDPPPVRAVAGDSRHHLIEAAEHLEAAGLHREATALRALARSDRSGERRLPGVLAGRGGDRSGGRGGIRAGGGVGEDRAAARRSADAAGASGGRGRARSYAGLAGGRSLPPGAESAPESDRRRPPGARGSAGTRRGQAPAAGGGVRRRPPGARAGAGMGTGAGAGVAPSAPCDLVAEIAALRAEVSELSKLVREVRRIVDTRGGGEGGGGEDAPPQRRRSSSGAR